MDDAVLAHFSRQATFCRLMGSPLTAAVLDALVQVLDRSTKVGERILSWQGDATSDALPLRLAGGVNALARSGQDAALTTAYAGAETDWPSLLRRVLSMGRMAVTMA